MSLPTTAAASIAPAARNTEALPTCQSVRRPVLRKYTGATTSNTLWRSASRLC